MYPEPHGGPRRANPEDESLAQLGHAHYRPYQEGRYHEEYVPIFADEDAELELLRGAIGGGLSRGWKLLSAIKEPGGAVLLLTWDTSGSFFSR